METLLGAENLHQPEEFLNTKRKKKSPFIYLFNLTNRIIYLASHAFTACEILDVDLMF